MFYTFEKLKQHLEYCLNHAQELFNSTSIDNFSRRGSSFAKIRAYEDALEKLNRNKVCDRYFLDGDVIYELKELN